MIHRRTFLRGLVAAPAIIRIAPLMAIRVIEAPIIVPEPMPIYTGTLLVERFSFSYQDWRAGWGDYVPAPMESPLVFARPNPVRAIDHSIG